MAKAYGRAFQGSEYRFRRGNVLKSLPNPLLMSLRDPSFPSSPPLKVLLQREKFPASTRPYDSFPNNSFDNWKLVNIIYNLCVTANLLQFTILSKILFVNVWTYIFYFCILYIFIFYIYFYIYSIFSRSDISSIFFRQFEIFFSILQITRKWHFLWCFHINLIPTCKLFQLLTLDRFNFNFQIHLSNQIKFRFFSLQHSKTNLQAPDAIIEISLKLVSGLVG